MKKIIIFLIVISSLFSCKEQLKFATQQKHSYNFVKDYSKIFSKNQLDSLNVKLNQYEDQTTNEIVIITKDSIAEDIVLYSVNLANEIGIGKKDKNNGLLILFIKNSRQIRISTGLVTEKILADSICQNIIDKQMIPEFKKGNFYKGINDALDKIIIKWESK